MIADRLTEELELFIEDSQEQLSYMEQAILDIQEDAQDCDSIGALFRAMHTIKGTAGMFGFDDVVNFTHVGENLLSEVREGKIELTEPMLDTFLEVKDHTQLLIDVAMQQRNLTSEEQDKGNRLTEQLEKYLAGEVGTTVEKVIESDTGTNTSEEHTNCYHISFRMHAPFFTDGMDIIEILKYFPVLGRVLYVFPVTCNIPPLIKYNPVEAYMGYEVLLESDFSQEDIYSTFEFVKDDIDLDIFASDDKKSLLNLLEKRKDKIDLKDQLLFYGCYPSKFFDEDETTKEFVEKPENITIETTTSTEVDVPVKRTGPKKKSIQKSFSLRVDSSKIDQLINQISEMVIANAKIAQHADTLDDTDLSESANILSEMLEDIRTGVMNIRMVQVGDSFKKFKRIVHDVAKKLDKEIDFEILGGETELDKMVVEKISDPLMHMLRNSIDHGIESKEERIAKGKSPVGKVTLNTYPDAGTIVIEISDDGGGLNKQKILEKALQNDVVTQGEHLSDKDIYQLIFEAGLSTANEVSDISGRGVGMDVVKQNIESLRGTIDIDSKEGEGSTFTIRLPLTLAIIDGFLVQSGDTKYIVPLEMIQECIELDSHYKKQMKEDEFINLRDTMLPLLDIRTLYKEAESRTSRENVVVVRYGDYRMGLRVDELFGEFQTVIKPLGEVFKNVPGISGGTLLGSGEIALIFDIPKLIEYKIKHKGVSNDSRNG